MQIRTPKSAFLEGIRKLNQENPVEAKTEFTQAITLSKDDNFKAKCYLQIGIIEGKERDFNAAILSFTTAITLSNDPDLKLECAYKRGVTYTKTSGNFGLGIADMVNGIRTEPKELDGKVIKYLEEILTKTLSERPRLANTLQINSLEYLFENYPEFYDRVLKPHLSFQQRYVVCTKDENFNLTEDYQDLLDPISNKLINDPIAPYDGHTYDRETLSKQGLSFDLEEFKTHVNTKNRLEKLVSSLENKARAKLLEERVLSSSRMSADREKNSREAWIAKLEKRVKLASEQAKTKNNIGENNSKKFSSNKGFV